MPPGKVPWEEIAAAVAGPLPKEVLLGPARGEDAALVAMGGEIFAVASDPITFTSLDAGRLAVLVNANDVAVRGAEPLYFTAVLLLAPDDAAAGAAEGILREIRETCESIGATLVGGHTEVSPGLGRTVIAGTMIGRVAGRAITSGGLKPGDRVGMTRWAGLEGTAILLGEFGERLKEVLDQAALAEAERVLSGNWLLVAPEAAAAAACPHVTAMHDVTEGGVGEALFEMAAASGVRIRVGRGAAGPGSGNPAAFPVPLLRATAEICRRMSLNPLGLIGSGSLLVGCAPKGTAALEAAIAAAGVPFAWIGRAEEAALGEPGSDLPRFERDEILKAPLLSGLEACVFDMDGTLIDSDYDWSAIKAALGLKGRSIIDELNGLAGAERDEKWKALSEIERRATRAARLKEGAGGLLDLLGRKGIRTALVTNNSGENTGYLLNKFGLFFDVVVTRESGLHKPSGAPVAEAIRRLGAAPSRTLCVGDSHYDVSAGREAACGWVCILFDREGRFSAEADLEFPDIPSFARYLEVAL